MGTFFKDSNGTFRRVPKMFLKNSDGIWRGVVKAFIKDSFGTWREIFNASYLSPQVSTEPELTSNDSFGYFDQGSTITLNRGTWTNSPTSYSLSIEGSMDGTNWTTFATGSGTTVTYLIDIVDATYPSYSFRGKVVATNAYGPGTFYTTSYSSTITLDVTATVSSPTANGATFSWSVSPSNTLYRREQTIVFYDSLSPATAAYTYTASTTAGSAVVSNAALISGRTYSAYVIVVSYDTEESVNLSNELTFTTVAPVPVGTDDTVTFSRDSQSSYNYSITSVGTWTGTPTSYRYQWYTYESTFGGNYSYFPISGATSSTFNASGVKLFEIMPIVWATNSFGESSAGYSLTNTNGTRPAGNIGSISAAANQIVYYKAPVISAFAVTGGAGSATYTYTVTNDDPTITLNISYSGQATGSFTPGVSGSVRTGLAAGTYNFVLTATNSASGNSYFVTSTVANVVVTAPLTAPVNTLAPAVTPVTGTAGVTTYTSTTGTWTGNPTPTYAYQWQYNDQGSLWVSMSGATSATFSPTANFFTTEARVSPIRCRVTATNSQAPSGVAATSNEVVVSRPVYVVTYDYQSATGGNGTASVNVTQGNSTSLPTPTRTNYTFGGWYTAITGGTFIGNGGLAYTPTASITLYARWTAINWTVSWDANGGTVSPTSNTGIQGSTVTAPTPTRTNFTFLYWRDSLSAASYLNQLSAGGTWTQSQTITFFAWWQQITYVVTYNANSGTVSPASATVNAGSSTTLPTPTRSGYTFNGWYTAASGGTLVGAAAGSYTPTAAITLYAQWTVVVVNYTMTWRANGGSSGDQTTGPFASGTAHTAPSPGTRTGYTFAGYYDTASLDFTVGPIASGGTYTPTANTTLQARWTAIVPSITRIIVSGNGTAGVTCAVTGTNMGSIQYTFFARDTGTSAWTQISAGTAAPSSATAASISTTGSVGTLPDQYYVDMQPFFGARSTSGANGGTGTAGTLRSTSGSPKNNQSGSVTVNF
jgi:uncharacterized repeat protein (TIGR02543 family)